MSYIFDVPKNIISKVLYKQTGILIPSFQIDSITAENICHAIVAFDSGDIDREKFDRVIIFNLNQILEREGRPLFYVARKNENVFTKFRINLFYN